MISNSYGIDDIQGFALITLQNHGIIHYTNLNLTKEVIFCLHHYDVRNVIMLRIGKKSPVLDEVFQ